MTQITNATLIDLRAIDPQDRLFAVTTALDALPPGESLCIAHEYAPRALVLQVDARNRGLFEWGPAEAGPAPWQARVSKRLVAEHDPEEFSCCSGGACGG